MANLIKCSLLMELAGYGFSETYYRSQDTNDLTQAMDALNNVVQARAALNGKDTVIQYMRTSSDSVSGDSYVLPIALSGSGGPGSADPDDAILVRFINDGNTRHSIKPLRGWPLANVNNGGLLVGKNFPNWGGALNTFAAQLKAQSFGWKSVSGSTFSGIATVVQDAGGTCTVGCATNIFQNGDVGHYVNVRITGVQGAATLNGVHPVKVIDLKTFTTKKRIPILPYIANSGVATVNTYGLTPIVGASALRTAERKAGRPFFKSPGRARPRKLA